MLVGALRRDPSTVKSRRNALPKNRKVVVYCTHGNGVSQGVAKELRDVIEDRTVQLAFAGMARCLEPARPIAPVVEMQQGKLQHVFRLMETAAAGQQRRAADRKQLLGREIDGIEFRPLPVTMPDRKVHIFPGKIDMVH
jgi:hypothetical protein